MGRVMADCRKFPSESNCSLTILGEEEEVIKAAVDHAVSHHQHERSDKLREDVKGMLEPESEYVPAVTARHS